MVPETDKEKIETAEEKISLFSGMDLASQELQNGLQEAMNIIAEATQRDDADRRSGKR